MSEHTAAPDTLTDLVDRLEGARDALMNLARQPTNTRFERDRLLAKCEGVLLALSYAREATR